VELIILGREEYLGAAISTLRDVVVYRERQFEPCGQSPQAELGAYAKSVLSPQFCRQMMRYFYLDPEVAGGLGRHTVMDVSVHPPIVTKLNYEFEGWLGDVILESFPCFIVTTEAKQALTRLSATGVAFDKVEVTTSHMFRELQPDLKLPPFVWLKASGHPAGTILECPRIIALWFQSAFWMCSGRWEFRMH